MSETLLLQIKTALTKAEDNEDWDDFMNLLADDVTFSATIGEGTPISGVFTGKEKVVEYFSTILPSVASFKQNQPTEKIAAGNKLIILGDDTFTVAKNNQAYRSPYAMVIELSNESISSILIIQDLSGIYMAYNSK